MVKSSKQASSESPLVAVLHDEIISGFERYLSKHTVESRPAVLDLSELEIGLLPTEKAKKLIEKLEPYKDFVVEVDLSDNQLGDNPETMSALMNVLARFSALARLDVSINEFMTDEMLSGGDGIKPLKTPNSFLVLVKGLEKLKTLKVFQYDYNQFSNTPADCLQSLVNCLAKLPCLEKLSFQGFAISCNSNKTYNFMPLFMPLGQISSLKTLDFTFSNLDELPENEFISFLCALNAILKRKQSNLEEVVLDYNSLAALPESDCRAQKLKKTIDKLKKKGVKVSVLDGEAFIEQYASPKSFVPNFMLSKETREREEQNSVASPDLNSSPELSLG